MARRVSIEYIHDIVDVSQLPVAFVVLSEDAAARVAKGEREAARQKEVIKKVLSRNTQTLALIHRQHVSDVKIKYKWLHDVVFVDAIPKNPSGKLLVRPAARSALFAEPLSDGCCASAPTRWLLRQRRNCRS